MLLTKTSHKQYQDSLLSFINSYYIDKNDFQPVLRRSKHIVALFIADLSGIFDLVKQTYKNHTWGAKPKDVTALFRSLLLMTYLKFTSIDEWIAEMRSNPLLAILSGFRPFNYEPSGSEEFLPDTIPGVGTFYDFQNRLVLTDKLIHKSHFRKPSKRRKAKKKLKKGEKLNLTRPGIIDRLCKRVISKGDSKLPESAQSKLNDILKNVFVIPSIELGIMGNPRKFNIAGDSTSILTAANPYGKGL